MFIKASRLRWAGYVKRMEENELVRRIMESKSGVRSEGRVKINEVYEDLMKL